MNTLDILGCGHCFLNAFVHHNVNDFIHNNSKCAFTDSFGSHLTITTLTKWQFGKHDLEKTRMLQGDCSEHLPPLYHTFII